MNDTRAPASGDQGDLVLGAGAGAGAGVGERSVFDDHKAPGAFRTIGEVARALGIRQHVLRYWEEQFPKLNPVKRSGNRRYYRPEDVELIETIDRLVHRQGYTLRGARLALDAGQGVQRTLALAPAEHGQEDSSDTTPGSERHAPSRPGWLAELLAIRADLAAALDA